MTNLLNVTVSAVALGLVGFAALPASAAPLQREGAAPLVLIGGWASRAQGNRNTYGNAYGSYGYADEGYGGPVRYGYRQPYYGQRAFDGTQFGDFDGSYDAY